MRRLLLPVIVLMLAAAQAALPMLWWLGGWRLEFLPALVAYGALTASRPSRAVLLAVLAGLALDSLSAGPFGLSVLGFGLPAAVLAGLGESLDRDLPWVQAGAGAWVAAFAAGVACAAAGPTFGALGKISVLAMLSAVMTPLLFFTMELLHYWLPDSGR